MESHLKDQNGLWQRKVDEGHVCGGGGGSGSPLELKDKKVMRWGCGCWSWKSGDGG